jgi:8-oxo-dGTP pyrophosphatase MutT (NUDIX family)
VIRPWPQVSTDRLFQTRVFALRRDRVRSPRLGVEQDVFVLETADWINVIPLTDNERVLMVRQWRHGTRSVTLEIPGGLVDPRDAGPEAAAARELREEVGCEARRFLHIGTVDPNPAIQSNACHTFLAEGAVITRDQELDDGEDIEVEAVPLVEIHRLVTSGEIRHSLVVAAFYHLWCYRGGR